MCNSCNLFQVVSLLPITYKGPNSWKSYSIAPQSETQYTLRKNESQNGSPKRAVWSSITQLSMALPYKREPIFKITLQESHFGSLFFLSAFFPKKVYGHLEPFTFQCNSFTGLLMDSSLRWPWYEQIGNMLFDLVLKPVIFLQYDGFCWSLNKLL